MLMYVIHILSENSHINGDGPFSNTVIWRHRRRIRGVMEFLGRIMYSLCNRSCCLCMTHV